ncbi:MAG: ArnT family glycosyltransferase [Microcystaceae cyanobacterium]
MIQYLFCGEFSDRMTRLEEKHTHQPLWHHFEKNANFTWGFSIAWLVLVNFAAFILNLGSTGLIDETEPLFAEAARQMTVTGNWITPYFNEVTRFDKPPLVYWLMAIGYKIIGVNEWAVRLPSALAAIALTVFSFFVLKKFGFATPAAATPEQISTPRVQRQLWISAWIGSTLVAFNLQTLLWSHQGVSDMLLSGCIGAALLCFFWGYATSNTSEEKEDKFNLFTPISNRWYLAFYIITGLAVLTKGPVGFVLPGMIILAFLFYVGNWQKVLFQEMGLVWGTLIFLAVTVPWYILVIVENGQAYIDSFFGYHNFERFTSVVNGHSAPWYFYFIIVLGMFAPWSIYLPLSMIRLRLGKRDFWQQQPRQSQLGLFAFWWFTVIFVFFSVAVTKLPSYTLPLIPAAAYLVTLTWSQEFSWATGSYRPKQTRFLSISIGFNLLLLIALSIGSLALPKLIGTDSAMDQLSSLLGQSPLPLVSASIWLITAILSLFFWLNRRQWRWIIVSNIIGFLGFIVFFVQPINIMVDQVRQLPLREIAEVITEVKQPKEQIMMIGFKKPTITFYSHETVGYFWSIYGDENDPAKQFLTNIPDTPDYPETILLLGESNQINELKLQPSEYKIITEKLPYRLVRVSRKRLEAI